MIPIYHVDAFAIGPFTGNPAAVCLLAYDGDPQWMRNVAMEMNLSETAFVVENGDDTFDLRWFTPAMEVDLCGHATLASAHILWEIGALEPDEVAVFHTRSGDLRAERRGSSIQLDFPSLPTEQIDPTPHLQQFLAGSKAKAWGRSTSDYLVELASAKAVREFRPDLMAIANDDARGVIVTAPGDGGYDIVSRYFAPSLGVDEDPVTGSAHACLGPYWAARLDRRSLKAYQASSRGGEIGVTVRKDRVLLTGRAVTTLRGELLA